MRLNVSLFKPMLFCDVDELLPKVEEPKMSRVELLFGLSTLGSCQNTEELWSTHARTHARTDETVFLPRQLFNPRAKRGEKTYENHRKPSKTKGRTELGARFLFIFCSACSLVADLTFSHVPHQRDQRSRRSQIELVWDGSHPTSSVSDEKRRVTWRVLSTEGGPAAEPRPKRGAHDPNFATNT